MIAEVLTGQVHFELDKAKSAGNIVDMYKVTILAPVAVNREAPTFTALLLENARHHRMGTLPRLPRAIHHEEPENQGVESKTLSPGEDKVLTSGLGRGVR